RACGVGVDVFSLGFGPRLVGKKNGRTDYRISAVPLGGYVKMVGEDPSSEISEKDKALSFTHKSVWIRMAIAVAGPLFNLLLAAVVFFVIAWTHGENYLAPEIAGVLEGSPAAAAGIQPGDEVTAINGRKVTSWEDVHDYIKESGKGPLTIVLVREDERRAVTLTPKRVTEKNLFGEDVTRYIVGISAAVKHRDVGFFEALYQGARDTLVWCGLTVQIIYKILAGAVSPKTLGGPIMIAQFSGQSAQEGILSLFVFLAVLSVNLGIINLFPIPILDGGHLVFYLIEAVRGKPLSLRTREIAQQVGLFLLILLMAFVIYNDLVRVFTGKTVG
ncbi:MAG: RIP metalloprotease RseP, partial [Deltaproteobacteria bacterium]|nr:RIP metalloprotease RseP [Deltaproteobacteria bacterium]